MKIVRSVEVWIFGAFGALVLAACLDKPVERRATGTYVELAPKAEEVQPTIDPMQPRYVVYVVGKRPSAAEKRALREEAR